MSSQMNVKRVLVILPKKTPQIFLSTRYFRRHNMACMVARKISVTVPSTTKYAKAKGPT